MNTVDELALQNAENVKFRSDYPYDSYSYKKGFLEGAEAVQKLTPIGKGLPTQDGFYIIKVEHSFPRNCRYLVAEFCTHNNTFYDEGSEYPVDDVIGYFKFLNLEEDND